MRPSATSAFRPWTDAEKAVVRSRYFTDRASRIAADLGRTTTAVNQSAKKQRLLKNRPWSDSDDHTLRNLWGERHVETLAAKLGRTAGAVAARATEIGLPRGCPAGMEYLSTAARRTGFDTRQLRTILGWARVPIKKSASRQTGATKRLYHVVDKFEVDEAVRAWMDTETIGPAAEARGVSVARLARRVAAIHGAPKKPGRWRRWRIPTAVIDAAMGVAA